MVGAHFNDHILCLLSEMTVNSSQQLAQVFMDKIAPCLVVPLGVWPENDSASSSSKHTIELLVMYMYFNFIGSLVLFPSFFQSFEHQA